jgi:hypothetical protein
MRSVVRLLQAGFQRQAGNWFSGKTNCAGNKFGFSDSTRLWPIQSSGRHFRIGKALDL